MWFATHFTVMSIFPNAVFCIFVLILFNFVLEKFLPILSFSKREVLIIYVMMCMASAIAGHGMTQGLFPLMGHAFWYATPENEWAELIQPYIPSWMVVSNKNALRAYYMGGSTLYSWEHIKIWSVPVLTWAGFILALVFSTMSINLIVRKQWVEKDKLRAC